ncbi:MAG: DUF4129 domain-containing protein [Thermoplasmata archaeon]
MWHLKFEKSTGLIIAAVIFLLSAWVMGSLFYILPDITGEGSLAPEYTVEEAEGIDEGMFEIAPIYLRIIRWIVIIGAVSILIGAAVVHLTDERINSLAGFVGNLVGLAIGALIGLYFKQIIGYITQGSWPFRGGSSLTGGFNPAEQVLSGPIDSNLYVPVGIMVVLVSLLLVKGALNLLRKEEVPDVEKDVSDTIDRTLKDLYGGKDTKSAIMRCYIEMSEQIQERGINEREFFTPREFRAKAVEKLDVSQAPLFVLTSMFEKARYSHHPLSEEEKKKSISSLEDLKKQLEVAG